MEFAQAETVTRAPTRVRCPEPSGDLTVESSPALFDRPTLSYRLLGFAFGWLAAIHAPWS